MDVADALSAVFLVDPPAFNEEDSVTQAPIRTVAGLALKECDNLTIERFRYPDFVAVAIAKDLYFMSLFVLVSIRPKLATHAQPIEMIGFG